MPDIERSYDADVLREWLAAIRTEIVARGSMADMARVRDYAESALGGKVPHWYTDEYRARIGNAAR